MKIDASSLMAARAAILQKNEALQKAAGVGAAPAGGTPATGGFTAAMSGALQQVNALQDTAGAASTAYEKGETTDIAAVMLARETASVGFQATLQVRNKLLSAYKDIMSMPV